MFNSEIYRYFRTNFIVFFLGRKKELSGREERLMELHL